MHSLKFPGEEMGEVVFFCGTNIRGKVDYLVFRVRNPSANKYRTIEVPVPKHISEHVMAHLLKFSVAPEEKPVERGNDEESL